MINILEIIKENNITEVWSDLDEEMSKVEFDESDINYPIIIKDNCFTSWGNYFHDKSGCLLWPSKEERTWERFVKQETYEPYTDVSEFIKDFGGKWVKSKENETYTMICGINKEHLSPKFWLDHYTLLDGTPIGKKS